MAPRFNVVKAEHLQCDDPIASDDFSRSSKALFESLQQHGCAIVQLPLSAQDALLGCRLRLESFFAKPHLKDLHAKADASQAGTGYALLDGKELFEVVASPQLAEELPSTISDSVIQALSTLDRIGRQALSAAASARAMGANPAAFQALLDPKPHVGTSSSVLHASLYQEAPAAGAASLQEHVDRGMLTIVSDSDTGLEVMSADGAWCSLELGSSCVAVLVGHTLQVASGGVLKACRHRVVPSSTQGSRRLSLAYKLRACPAAELMDGAVQLHLRQGTAGSNAGSSRSVLGKRTIADVLRYFEATHTSINRPAPQPAAALAAAAMTANGAHAHPASTAPAQASQQQQGPSPQQHQQQEQQEHPTAHSNPGTSNTVMFIVADQTGAEWQFRVRTCTRFEKIMAAYSMKMGVAAGSFRFVYDRQRLHDHDTPAGKEMEDGDTIYAMLEQVGD